MESLWTEVTADVKGVLSLHMSVLNEDLTWLWAWRREALR